MIKRYIFNSLFLFVFTCGLFGQSLRDAVVIVRPVYTDGTVKFLNEFSETLRKEGYGKAADIMKAYAQGGFGTGFVYVDSSSGKKYVITNKHVVAQAKHVNIEFSFTGKIMVNINECKIVAIHEDMDLAIVELPEDAEVKGVLNLSDKKVYDGEDVFSAGFPGLGSEPSWQLGKGIVSNSELYNKDLTNGIDIAMIQHTAQLDPGSSGGPLLVRNENSPLGYDIVGINTWKVHGRENVNIAIPATELSSFVDKYLAEGNLLTEENLRKRTTDLIQASQNDFKRVLPFISYDYLSQISVTLFFELVNSASKEVQEYIIESFKSGTPIEGVRIGLAYAINQNFSKKVPLFESIENYSAGNAVTVLLKQDNKMVSTTWLPEQGTWRIADISSLNLKSLENKGLTKRFVYKGAIRVGGGIPVGNNMFDRYYSIAFESVPTPFFSYHVVYNKGVMGDYIKENRENTGITPIWYSFDFGVGGQYAISTSALYVVPYVKIFGGMGVFDDVKGYDIGLSYGFSLGSDFAYKIGRRNYVLLGLGYKRHIINTSSTGGDKMPINILDASIGFAW